MDAIASLPGQADSSLKKAHQAWSGWALFLTLALVVALPLIYLAFISGEASPAVSSAPAAATAGSPAKEITISGEVLHPGRYTLLPDERVVLRAGGLTSSAKDTIKVIRNVLGRGNVTLVVNLRKVLTKPMPGNDLPLLPGDVIVIDQRLIKF